MQKGTETPPAPPGYRYIFVRSFRHAKSGKLVIAEEHGRRAFRLLVKQ